MPEPLTYTVDEAAALLGIGRSTYYELVKRGEVPFLKIGQRIVVPRKQLEELLTRGSAAGPEPHPREVPGR